MEFSTVPGPVPMPDLKPGDLVYVSLGQGEDLATYSGIVSTVDPGTEADEMMNVTLWTEPALEGPANGEGQ